MALLPTRIQLNTLAANDLVHVVDVSDVTDDPSGSSRKMEASDIKTFMSPPATEGLAGIAEIATDAEVFDKVDDSRSITPLKLFNAPFFHQWTSGNSDSGLGQLVPSGAPATIGYNLLSTFLESNESNASNIPLNFKDTSGSPQATILDETNDKFIFPSNLKTFNTQYVGYNVRVNLTVDFSTTNNTTTKFYVRARRVIDDSIVTEVDYIQSDFPAETGVELTRAVSTFVNSESDPFVVDGVYLDILNDSNSGGTVTLQDVSVRIFKN